MAKTVEELIPQIEEILEANDGKLGIGEFLQKTRSIVVSPRLLMDALEKMVVSKTILVNDQNIELLHVTA